ncbi:MAG: glycosyltransferase family 4 protein, partial [Tepidisphaeraceae bacterium]
MKVLHVGAGNLYGGIERVLVTLAAERGACAPMEPHFAACFEGRLTRELREIGAPVHVLGDVRMARPWTVWAARRRLDKLLRRERFDAVVCHACWPHALAAPLVRRAGIPLITWAHDTLGLGHWIERLASRTRPDLVLANSQPTRESVDAVFPGALTTLLYYPVPAPTIRDVNTVRDRVRAEHGAAAGSTVILSACRLERWKGHALLIDALVLLRDVPGWTCWIAGGVQRETERAYLAELETSAGRNGIADRVKFLGQRDDVPQLMTAADVHCQPNVAPEPFGIAFVEALHAGLPVVTTAMGGPLEIVTNDCGVLVPPGHANALAASLRELVLNPQRRRRLGLAGPA